MKISGVSPNRFNYNTRSKNQNNQTQNIPKKNINFGRFADDNARQVTKRVLENYAKRCLPYQEHPDDEFIMLDKTDLVELHTNPDTGKIGFNLLVKSTDFKTQNAVNLIEYIEIALEKLFPRLRNDISVMDDSSSRPIVSIFAANLIEAQEDEDEKAFYDSLSPEEQAEIDREKAEAEEERKKIEAMINAQASSSGLDIDYAARRAEELAYDIIAF